jgi:3-isopropylmalate/(R)-2-methylmalate dehydratase small subunit
MTTRIEGRAFVFGDHVSGDNGIIEFGVIRDFTKPFDEKGLGAMCFSRVDPRFPAAFGPGDIVVAGRNFAHHSHPQVAVSLKAAGLGCVVCESTETGFLRKCLNIGFPLVTCRGIAALTVEGDVLAVDLAAGTVENRRTGDVLRTAAYSPRMLGMITAGGLIPFLKAELAA